MEVQNSVLQTNKKVLFLVSLVCFLVMAAVVTFSSLVRILGAFFFFLKWRLAHAH